MNRTIGYTILIAVAAVCIVLAAVRPDLLNDKNTFLKNFVNHEFINVLGIILAITLASTANIHLAFNRIEERHNSPNALSKSRHNLKKYTYWLIGQFVVGAVLVVLKPISADNSTPTLEALFNSGAMIILLWQVLILVVLTQIVFLIEPEFPNSNPRALPGPIQNPNEDPAHQSQSNTQEKTQQ